MKIADKKSKNDSATCKEGAAVSETLVDSAGKKVLLL